MPWVKVSFSVYGSSDLRSPWNANRNVAAEAGSVSDVAASAAANSAVLNFIVLSRPLDGRIGLAARSWQVKRRPACAGRIFGLSGPDQIVSGQIKSSGSHCLLNQ